MLRKMSLDDQKTFCELADRFFVQALKYLEDRFDYNDTVFATIKSLNLSENKPIQWKEILELCNKTGINMDTDKLYAEITKFNSLVEKIPTDLPIDRKWSYFFKREKTCMELLKVISFVLSVPPSNAYTERVFSLMNHAWSENRNRLTVSMVKSELQVRLNFNLSCIEFKSFIEQNQSLILAAKSNSKYRWKA